LRLCLPRSGECAGALEPAALAAGPRLSGEREGASDLGGREFDLGLHERYAIMRST
jgi:hypothetical protein